MKELGCTSFSLLFDDIETEMCPADKQTFSSFAHAQVAITNAVYQHLGEPETFLFCPTGQAVGSPKTATKRTSLLLSAKCFKYYLVSLNAAWEF